MIPALYDAVNRVARPVCQLKFAAGGGPIIRQGPYSDRRMPLTVIALLSVLTGREIGYAGRVLLPAFINPDQADALPFLLLVLLVVALALLIVVLRQRRALRRNARHQSPSVTPALAPSSEPIQKADLARSWMTEAIAAARQAMQPLAASPDFVAFERSLALGPALADLERALAPNGSDTNASSLATVLRGGLEQAGWLQRIFRAELLLDALAAPGTAWSGLGRALGAIGAAARAELAPAGVEVLRPGLLAPVQRGHEVADEALSELRHVTFINRAVRTAVGGVAEPAILVVDCLRFGMREVEPGSAVPRVSPALVVLYAPMLWRAAGPA